MKIVTETKIIDGNPVGTDDKGGSTRSQEPHRVIKAWALGVNSFDSTVEQAFVRLDGDTIDLPNGTYRIERGTCGACPDREGKKQPNNCSYVDRYDHSWGLSHRDVRGYGLSSIDGVDDMRLKWVTRDLSKPND